MYYLDFYNHLLNLLGKTGRKLNIYRYIFQTSLSIIQSLTLQTNKTKNKAWSIGWSVHKCIGYIHKKIFTYLYSARSNKNILVKKNIIRFIYYKFKGALRDIRNCS